jgi:hypothetical protein
MLLKIPFFEKYRIQPVRFAGHNAFCNVVFRCTRIVSWTNRPFSFFVPLGTRDLQQRCSQSLYYGIITTILRYLSHCLRHTRCGDLQMVENSPFRVRYPLLRLVFGHHHMCLTSL